MRLRKGGSNLPAKGGTTRGFFCKCRKEADLTVSTKRLSESEDAWRGGKSSTDKQD